MQPFARPVARLVFGHVRLGHNRAVWQGKTVSGQSQPVSHSRSSVICLGCDVWAIGASERFYSTNIPPKAPNTPPSSSNGPKPEFDLIEKLRAEHAKAESSKSKPTEPESVKIKEPKPANPKPRTAIPEDTQSPRDLPSWAESRRTKLTQKFSEIMDKFQARVLNATQTLNDVTGYSSIEHIKNRNAELEIALDKAHERVRNARQEYKTSHTKRAATQREVTTLLARKDSWSAHDLERFTELYRADHVLESEVAASQEDLTEAEADEQSLNQRLNAGILKRYHEEQIWSDRIRRASTWGTWGLMGMNFILFIVFQFVAEPWKRRRLVKGVVAEETVILEEVRSQLQEVKLALEKWEQIPAMQPLVEAVKAVEEPLAGASNNTTWPDVVPTSNEPVVATPSEVTPEPSLEVGESSEMSWQEKVKEAGLDHDKWRALAEDLFSERQIDMTMRNASLLALQGALAGAALTGSIALLFVRRS
ncbi:Mdm33 family-domain-containing protein [Mariannaea sp. PMI_226]|nr:Mdm33 family-domain-containing protein [Mariannaea sp. PMI_226]